MRRIGGIALAFFLISVSVYAIKSHRIYIPYGSKYHNFLVEFINYGIILPVLSILLASAALISIIIDHYDKRNNEYRYEKFKNMSIQIGFILYIVSLFFGHRIITHH